MLTYYKEIDNCEKYCQIKQIVTIVKKIPSHDVKTEFLINET